MIQHRVAIAGLGTVGASLIQLLGANSTSIAGIEVVAVSARSRNRDRGVDLAAFEWFDDPVAMAAAEGSDIFVELIGGEEGIAKAAIEAALDAGKHVVTANKALIARHGLALAARAEERGVALRFEAAVAGGIPVVGGLRDGLAGSSVTQLQGVLNGTCNFILAAMENGQTYDAALEEAQRIGFAEADPSFDVDGIDAAQKLAILSAIGFGAMPTLADIAPQGISAASPGDLAAARTLGLRMKLVAIIRREGEGLAARVGPALVPLTSALDIGGGGENIVVVDAEPLGRVAFSGPGAGGGPTASAVATNLAGIARGARSPSFGRPAASIDTSPDVQPDAKPVAHFLRVLVDDRPGVLAKVAEMLAEAQISVETIRQSPVSPASPVSDGEEGVELVITTHAAVTADLVAVCLRIEALSAVHGRPSVYPILKETQS